MKMGGLLHRPLREAPRLACRWRMWGHMKAVCTLAGMAAGRACLVQDSGGLTMRKRLHSPLHPTEKTKPHYRMDSRVSLCGLVGRVGLEPTTKGL